MIESARTALVPKNLKSSRLREGMFITFGFLKSSTSNSQAENNKVPAPSLTKEVGRKESRS